ncbi:hypothetical protein FQZ97_1159440 [compost metagenome]
MRDGQHHVFLALTLGTDGAGVFAAMAGVDHHDDVPLGVSFVDGYLGRSCDV